MAGAELGELARGHQAALGLEVGHDVARDRALVELVAHRGDARLAPARGPPLRLDQAGEAAAEVGLDEALADLRRPAPWQHDRLGARPGAVEFLVLDDGLGEQAMHGKATGRNVVGGLGDIAEAHGAVAGERLAPGVDRRRRDAAQHAERQVATVIPDEVVGRRGARPAAQTRDRHHLVGLREVDDDRCNAGRAHDVGLQDAERHGRGNPGIDGVASPVENARGRVRGEVMVRRHRPATAAYGGAVGLGFGHGSSRSNGSRPALPPLFSSSLRRQGSMSADKRPRAMSVTTNAARRAAACGTGFLPSQG